MVPPPLRPARRSALPGLALACNAAKDFEPVFFIGNIANLLPVGAQRPQQDDERAKIGADGKVEVA